MRNDFAPDCERCAALCCLALALDAGPAFAIDKPAGLPCPHLSRHACGQYSGLRAAGFSGCARYTCLGAGQIVVQEVFAGASWRDDPALIGPMSEAFRVLREVQDLRSQLAAAAALPLTAEQVVERDALGACLAGPWTAVRLAEFDPVKAQTAFRAFASGLRESLAQTARSA
jgi:hypothetical protein